MCKLPFTDIICILHWNIHIHVHNMYYTGMLLSKLRFQNWITSHRNLNTNEQKLEYKRTVPVENTIIVLEKGRYVTLLNFLCDFRYFTSAFFGAF